MTSLPDIFYTMPVTASMTIDRKDLKELLMSTGGSVIACGRLYDIQAKHLGAGVYRVTLERTN